MSERNFRELLEAQYDRDNFVCVGLDPAWDQIPERFKKTDPASAVFHFNESVIDQTCDIVGAYKLCTAFYSEITREALLRTVRYIREHAPSVCIILDEKNGNPGHANVESAKNAFDVLGVDAVTVFPNPDMEALEPFLERRDKGVFVVCYMSTDGKEKYDELPMAAGTGSRSKKLYLHIARQVTHRWNSLYQNCGLIVSSKNSEVLRMVRGAAGDMPILAPGIGAQGGDPVMAYMAGKNRKGKGIILGVSRSAIFAEDPRSVVMGYNDLINRYL